MNTKEFTPYVVVGSDFITILERFFQTRKEGWESIQAIGEEIDEIAGFTVSGLGIVTGFNFKQGFKPNRADWRKNNLGSYRPLDPQMVERVSKIRFPGAEELTERITGNRYEFLQVPVTHYLAAEKFLETYVLLVPRNQKDDFWKPPESQARLIAWSEYYSLKERNEAVQGGVK